MTISLATEAMAGTPVVACGNISPLLEKVETGLQAVSGPGGLVARNPRESWQEMLASLGMKTDGGGDSSVAGPPSGHGEEISLREKQERSQPRAGVTQAVGGEVQEPAQSANPRETARGAATTAAVLNVGHGRSTEPPVEAVPESGRTRKSVDLVNGTSRMRVRKQESARSRLSGEAAQTVPVVAVGANLDARVPVPAGSASVMLPSKVPAGRAEGHKPADFTPTAGAGEWTGIEAEWHAAKLPEGETGSPEERLTPAVIQQDKMPAGHSVAAGQATAEGELGHGLERNPAAAGAGDQESSPSAPAAQPAQAYMLQDRVASVPAGAGAASPGTAGKRMRSLGEVAVHSMQPVAGIPSERERHVGSPQGENPLSQNAAAGRELFAAHAMTGGPGNHAGAAPSESAGFSGRETFSMLDAGTGAGAPRWSHATPQHAEAGFQDPALGWVGVRADASGSGIHAAVVPGSAEAAQALSGHMAGLGAHLAAQHSAVQSVLVAAPDAGGAAWGGGQSGQSAQSDEGGKRREGSMTATADAMPRPALAGSASDSRQAAAAGAGGGFAGRGGKYISVLA